MLNYILRRLILLPITLFFIIVVNFVIVNLAPGDPVTVTEVSAEGMATKEQNRAVAFGSDDRYLQFREYYGLTLPLLFNSWPSIDSEEVNKTLWQLVHRKWSSEDNEEIPFKEYDHLRITFGDKARFIMPLLLAVIEDSRIDLVTRRMASGFFIRGGTRQAFLGPNLTDEQRRYNAKITQDNSLLSSFLLPLVNDPITIDAKVKEIHRWYEENQDFYNFTPSTAEKVEIFFFDTRFVKYLSRVLTLDFGTLRNDSNKTVLDEVTRRFKYSLTLALLPMLITFVLCQIFGFLMALKQGKWPDLFFNYLFLILYAIPVFVVAPFLIEKVALNNTFPFTDIPIPISGFSSPDSIYLQETSLGRLLDIARHLCLPLLAIIYGSLAAEARLSRTAILEVMRQDYVRTARAKGLSHFDIRVKHIGRNAAITITTSIAGSLGIILGGSLIVETLFEINGFGKFFYDAIINRDYNVIMFSAFAGSFLTLIGYLLADIAYTMLDPRVTLE